MIPWFGGRQSESCRPSSIRGYFSDIPRSRENPKILRVDDADRERKTKSEFKAGSKVEVSRFKGLGEMPPAQLRETTMDPAKRTLLKVVAAPEERAATAELVESLMGRRPELRFQFIQEHARTVEDVDV